jgi:hypothetical protein
VSITREDVLKINELKSAVTIFIDRVKGGVDGVLSNLGHRSSDGDQEFLVGDEVIVSGIKLVEKVLKLSIGEAKPKVGHSLLEFVGVERHGMVVIHDAEVSAKADDSSSSTRKELLSELCHEHLSMINTTSSGEVVSAIESFSKLSVIDGAVAILVIKSEESFEVL